MEKPQYKEYMKVTIKYSSSDKESKKESQDAITTWIEMILNKYGTSIHKKEAL